MSTRVPSACAPQIDWQELADLGFSVFPVRSNDKLPAMAWKRFQSECASPAEIEEWQASGNNCGIATGTISNLIVLDCDSPEAVQEAERKGVPPSTLAVKTAKGAHFYFSHPSNKVHNRVGILPGMDLRGDGGFVVAPGSIHPSGARYEWMIPPAWGELHPMPEWLVKILERKPEPTTTSHGPCQIIAETAYGAKARDSELTFLRNAPVGQRNHQLNRSAFALAQLSAARELDEEQARARLVEAAHAIGLDPAEIETTLNSGWEAGLLEPRSPSQAAAAKVGTICAAPFVMPDPTKIPPRPWVMGHWLQRGTVTAIIAPGGTRKSALMTAAALSLAAGQELLGKSVWGGPKRVWLWNLEDDRDELARQFSSCALHHELTNLDYADRLFVNDAETSLCTATKGPEGFVILEPVLEALLAEITARKIDALIVDPFVSSHQAEENDNGQIDAITKRWARIAYEANCSVILVHHSRKMAGQKVDAESSRGASAMANAARTVLVLNRMTGQEARKLGISENDRRRYIAVSNDKSNRAPPESADWFRLASVRLANGGPEGGDSVGVIERWMPPDEATAVLAIRDQTRAKIQTAIVSGQWRAHHTANDWAGNAVAQVIEANLQDPAEKRRVTALLKDMLAKGQLRAEERKDNNRHNRTFIVMGQPVEKACDTKSMW